LVIEATATTVLRPFVWDYLGEPVQEETLCYLLGFMMQGKITEADALTIWLDYTLCELSMAFSALTSIIPPFYARYLSCRNPPNLSWLGTGTKYAR